MMLKGCVYFAVSRVKMSVASADIVMAMITLKARQPLPPLQHLT